MSTSEKSMRSNIMAIPARFERATYCLEGSFSHFTSTLSIRFHSWKNPVVSSWFGQNQNLLGRIWDDFEFSPSRSKLFLTNVEMKSRVLKLHVGGLVSFFGHGVSADRQWPAEGTLGGDDALAVG